MTLKLKMATRIRKCSRRLLRPIIRLSSTLEAMGQVHFSTGCLLTVSFGSDRERCFHRTFGRVLEDWETSQCNLPWPCSSCECQRPQRKTHCLWKESYLFQ